MKKRKKKLRFVCGTPAGYFRHLRRQEHPCSRCLIGSETYSKEEIESLIGDFQSWDYEQRLWKTYQLSTDRFAEIFDTQGRRCACCSNTNPGEFPWHVDHEQQTGLIRGILCSSCNAGIGHLGDDLAGLRRAVAYLQAHQTRGGYEKAQKNPRPEKPLPKISVVMRRCFDLFKQGVPCSRVVVILKLTPETVNEIHALWTTSGGKVTRVSRHRFQIPKDAPPRFMCACGYTAPWKDPDEMRVAIDLVNTHVTEAENNPETEWKRLEAEEVHRRLQQELSKKEENRQKVIEELQRKAESYSGGRTVLSN